MVEQKAAVNLSYEIKQVRERSIYFELSIHPDVAIFQIQDRGIGIPLKEQQDIFETFFRGSNVGNIPGAGLGLSIVQKGIELNRGKIMVASEVGAGTIFSVELPYVIHR